MRSNLMRKLTAMIITLALVGAFGASALAQGSAESSVKGNLSGIISDSTGAIVPGAKVTLTGPEGVKSETSNQDGGFLFPLLTPGTYALKVEKGQFKTAEVKGVEVLTGKTSALRLSLQPGETTTVVEVTASALSVDVTSTSVAANLNDTFYSQVPVARGVTGLFYASPGVTSGGGTGAANPSISGGTGLENLYVADGVNITDGGFGGIGVFSRIYGSLGTGINLSFVKEVQVKTGGFEAQYGKSTGGIVQIVTKSGGNKFSGSVGAFFAPSSFEAERAQPDDFQAGGGGQQFNLAGKRLNQSNYDIDAEIGGYVPGYKDHLFFFGSFNPQWNTTEDQFAQFHNPQFLGTNGAAATYPSTLGTNDTGQRVYSYAAKLSWKLNDKHNLESSVFGDPTYGDFDPNGSLAIANHTGDNKLQFGTRNFVVRYNGTLSPSWLVNASWSWGHNNLSDTPAFPDIYSITDLTQRFPCNIVSSVVAPPPCTAASNVIRGNNAGQGYGYFENTEGDNYGFNADTTKSFHFLGNHSVTAGYRFERSHYNGVKTRTGARYLSPTTDVTGAATASDLYGLLPGDPLLNDLLTTPANAEFQLRLRGNGSSLAGCTDPVTAATLVIPGLDGCGDGSTAVILRQVRGEFGNPNFVTQGDYHTVFAQDSWAINKYVTINAGLRWEQQRLAGVNNAYTFTDNWSPRVGISIDPWGNRKTKVYANFGRYNESIPLDLAIRSLSSEKDTATLQWLPPTDGAGHVVVNPDGTITPILDSAHLLNATLAGVGSSNGTGFAPGTRMEYLDEYVVGFEHEFGNSGVIFTARYTDRRIKRIVEDLAALSPEAANSGLAQQFLIGNPSASTDLFTNPQQVGFAANPVTDFDPATGAYTGAPQPACGAVAGGFYTGVTDSNGNFVTNSAGNNAVCIVPGPYANGANPGDLVSDGQPDGFVDPVRIYKSMEFEVNKSYSKGWQLRANYRIAKLFGNYEGSFRNDNNQDDPNISSLFDFTRGDFNLLGQQFVAGVLNQDVRHTVNGFVSYTFSNKWMKGLTIGTSTRFQTGTPISNFFAHPVYQNAGEIPFCADNTTNCTSARGSLGRTHNNGQVDVSADYPIRISEKYRIRLNAALFNITDLRTQLRVDQRAQVSLGVPNADFLKPVGGGVSLNPGYQRPFYARFGVKLEF
jgi:carboxypeptidase family protein